MKAVGRYDGTLQMFVEESREPDIARLGFLRWLAEHGKLEHRPFGPSTGKLTGAGDAVVEDIEDEWAIPAA